MNPVIESVVSKAAAQGLPVEEYVWFHCEHLSNNESFNPLWHMPFSCTAVTTTNLLLLATRENNLLSAIVFYATGKPMRRVLLVNQLPTGHFVPTWVSSSRFITDEGDELTDEEAVVFVADLLDTVCGNPAVFEGHIPTRKGWSKKTVRGRHLPLFEWKTVVIKPKPATTTGHKGGTHASPRLHDRRGHWVTSKLGKRFWRKESKVGSAKAGIVFHDYEVRQ